MGIVLFVFSAALNVVAVHIPAMVVLAPMAGQLYGPVWGSILLVIGETLGAMVWFLAFRLLGKNIIGAVVRKLFARRIVYPESQPVANLAWPVIIGRQFPFVPLELISASLSFTKMSLARFLAVITLANIPIDTIYVCVGTGNSKSVTFGILVALVLFLVWTGLGGWQNHHLQTFKKALPRFQRIPKT